MSEVTNPIQACNDIFLKPRGVFAALSHRDNWSWIPFVIVILFSILPTYLYFGVVDYGWYQDQTLATQMPDASPKELENIKAMSTASTAQTMTLIFGGIGVLVVTAIVALYHTLVTKNDDKSIHSFLDWFGAQWWFALPMVFNALISCVLIMLAEPGAQLNQSVIAPVSLAYISGMEMSSAWFNFAQGVRLDTIWGVYLTTVCLSEWTNFSTRKSLIVALIPVLFMYTVGILFIAL